MTKPEKTGLSYKARRRWALVILLVGLPIYIMIAVTIMNSLNRPPILVEFLIYIALGVVWVLPFKFIFRGIGQADPDEEQHGNDRH
ncbi:DUF2842 domain-containing protein [Sedimentitalea todarodis]|uniref:DUF2842 domain-containing protein n=1 Tax=Sedimentitalea todarodis TaxID=1631240 RepID=A0ABU3VF92_9RHOB|nr:DUF2842 domain-containing protein [Sedimentitalea todarodis]MDU9004839.1 DUF2842 domain-containing protein [Sedimentitalea todarodis]